MTFGLSCENDDIFDKSCTDTGTVHSEKVLQSPNIIMGKNAVNIGQNYFHNVDFVCTRFHNEKSEITTTHEDQRGQLNGVPN